MDENTVRIAEKGAGLLCEFFEVNLTEAGNEKFLECASSYSWGEIQTAIKIAYKNYTDSTEAFIKLGGILFNRKRTAEKYFVKR